MSDLKGDHSVKKLVCKDADAPDVNFAVVRQFFDDFWGGVDRSAALGGSQHG